MADALKRVWADVLGKETSGIQDDSNFFEIGGDSVQAIKLAAKANAATGLKLNSQRVFLNPTFSSTRDAATVSPDSADGSGRPANDQSPPQTNPFERLRSSLEAYRLVGACLAQCGLHGALLEDILPCTPFQRELMSASHNLGCWTFQAVFEISPNAEGRAKQVINDLHARNAIFRTRIACHDTGRVKVTSGMASLRRASGSLQGRRVI